MTDVYTHDEVLAEYNKQAEALKRIEMQSEDVAVVIGQGWVFNMKDPINPALSQRLERHRGDISYEAGMAYITLAFVKAHVGLTKRFAIKRGAGPNEMTRRRQLAADAVKKAIEEVNAESILQYTTEAARAEKAVIGIRNRTHGMGSRRVNKIETEELHTQETRIYVIFPAEKNEAGQMTQITAASESAPLKSPAAKIMQLKGLLDAGAINQSEYDEKKAQLLTQM